MKSINPQCMFSGVSSGTMCQFVEVRIRSDEKQLLIDEVSFVFKTVVPASVGIMTAGNTCGMTSVTGCVGGEDRGCLMAEDFGVGVVEWSHVDVIFVLIYVATLENDSDQSEWLNF